MYAAPLTRLHVEHLDRVEDLLAVESADDVDLVVEGGSARVRSLPVHGRDHLPLILLRIVSLARAHPRAAVVSAERVDLAALKRRVDDVQYRNDFSYIIARILTR